MPSQPLSYETRMNALNDLVSQQEEQRRNEGRSQDSLMLSKMLGDVGEAFSRPSVTAAEILAGVRPRDNSVGMSEKFSEPMRMQASFQKDQAQGILDRYKAAMEKASIQSDMEGQAQSQAQAQQKQAWEERKLGLEQQNKLAQIEALNKNKMVQMAAVDKAKKETPKEYSAAQYKAGGFAQRLEQSEQVFKDLEGKGYNRASRVEEMKGYLPREFQGEELRAQDQAERNFVNAVLRPESGAAISQVEFNNAIQQYFPRPGDSPQVLTQKAANRASKIAAAKAEAGPAYKSILENYAQIQPDNRYQEKPTDGQALAAPAPLTPDIDIDAMTESELDAFIKGNK